MRYELETDALGAGSSLPADEDRSGQWPHCQFCRTILEVIRAILRHALCFISGLHCLRPTCQTCDGREFVAWDMLEKPAGWACLYHRRYALKRRFDLRLRC